MREYDGTCGTCGVPGEWQCIRCPKRDPRQAPTCPTHGQMRYVLAMAQWECRGWDGEGCDHVVTDEELERGGQLA